MPKSKTPELSPPELSLDDVAELRAVRGGADILDHQIGRNLRRIDREHPGLLDICDPMGTYGVKDQHPVFGVICTPAGCALLDKLSTLLRGEDA